MTAQESTRPVPARPAQAVSMGTLLASCAAATAVSTPPSERQTADATDPDTDTGTEDEDHRTAA
ncbi:hypothetical protein ABT160_37865 [Streptomyces sp. NPDC001941]|uniref:hypothetical protein n=1 Tax=Streptomyces sp. NPDC001941 TaxID=3154659 RepID=UPI00331EE109